MYKPKYAVALALLTIAVVVAFAFRKPEPSYHGKRLSQWMRQYADLSRQDVEAHEAIGITSP